MQRRLPPLLSPLRRSRLNHAPPRLGAAAGPTTIDKADDFLISRNLWCAHGWSSWLEQPLRRRAAAAATAAAVCRAPTPLFPPAPPLRRFHVQRFFAVLEEGDISKYDPSNDTIGADIPFSQNILARAAACPPAALARALC